MKDIAILGEPATAESLLDFNGKIAEGIYRLVQKVLVLLFSDEENSYAYEQGTQLPSVIPSANIGDAEELQNQFNIAVSKVQEMLSVSQPLDLPDDETLERIETVITRDTGSDAAKAEITVISAAGDSVTVNVPLTFEVNNG